MATIKDLGLVNAMTNRLKEDLIETSQFGRMAPKRIESYAQLDSEKGITRPDGTEENKKIRDYAVERMKEAGLEVKVDKIGNIFGGKRGCKTDKGAVMSGSHLDSVMNGGMFDGALGVFAAIEAVRRMNDEGFENERPLEVVAFTGEEGTAFPPALLGSSVLAGKTSIKDGLNRKNPMGQTLEEALENIGYKGSFESSLDNVEYFVETHIEQGPILDREGISIGVVEAIVGLTWIFATILGEENHAGGTPMHGRRDALVAAADIVSFVRKRANEMIDKLGSSTAGTVGKLNTFPSGITTIPGKVEIGIDIRDVVPQNLKNFESEILKAMGDASERYGVDIRTDVQYVSIPVKLADEVINVVDSAASQLGIKKKRMISGAGHDAENMAEKVKAGMIFVPSVNGKSHVPLEWTNWEDIEKGAQVLTQTLKSLSRR